MRQLVKLIKAEILMLYGELKHYYFNYIFYNLGIVIFFIGIIKNFDFKDNVILQIVSLITWHIITSSISYLCNVIQDEAVMGTLEQLFFNQSKYFENLSFKSNSECYVYISKINNSILHLFVGISQKYRHKNNFIFYNYNFNSGNTNGNR